MNRYDPLWAGKVTTNDAEASRGSAHDAFWNSPRVYGNTVKIVPKKEVEDKYETA